MISFCRRGRQSPTWRWRCAPTARWSWLGTTSMSSHAAGLVGGIAPPTSPPRSGWGCWGRTRGGSPRRPTGGTTRSRQRWTSRQRSSVSKFVTASPSQTRTAQFVSSITRYICRYYIITQELQICCGQGCPERNVLSPFVFSREEGRSRAKLYSMFRFPDSNTVHLQVFYSSRYLSID